MPLENKRKYKKTEGKLGDNISAQDFLFKALNYFFSDKMEYFPLALQNLAELTNSTEIIILEMVDKSLEKKGKCSGIETNGKQT